MHAQNIDIDDMQCWVFRMAQNRWKKSPEECVKIFQENNVFEAATHYSPKNRPSS